MKRKPLLFVVICAMLLVLKGYNSFGSPSFPDSIDMAKSQKNDEDKKNSPALVSILVTGDGKPIVGAEVRLKCPSSESNGTKAQTDDSGAASFNCVELGSATLSIRATGYTFFSDEISLKAGQQRLPIRLKSIKAVK